MKKKSKLVIILIIGAVLLAGFPAAHAKNPFAQAEEKITEGTNYLVVVARVLFVLVIVVVGIGTMFGYFRKETAVKVLSGAVLIASATEIANFFLN